MQFLKNVKAIIAALILRVLTIHAQDINIIPYPNSVEMQKSVFSLPVSCHIYYDKECKNEADYLQ